MTNEEAASILEKSKRQNEIMRDSPTTFWKSTDMGSGIANAKKRIEALSKAIEALKGQPTGVPLTLEQLRQMDGQPVWIMEQPDWGHWELSEDAEDYIADRDPDFYGLSYPDPEGKGGLHKIGWIAYAYLPAHIDLEARIHELETAYRLEKCEDGPECAELGKVRRALEAAEVRAEKAETQLREAKHCIAGLSMLIKAVDGKMVMETVLPMARNRLEKYKEKYPSATAVLDMKKENEHGNSEKQHDYAGVSG